MCSSCERLWDSQLHLGMSSIHPRKVAMPEQVIALAVILILALIQQTCSKGGVLGESLKDARVAKIQSACMTAFGTTRSASGLLLPRA